MTQPGGPEVRPPGGSTLAQQFASLLRRVPAAETDYASHNLHPYPARFLPHFPRLFITEYTRPGDLVLDPMCGSGTALIEAALLGRRAVGVDIDPIAALIARVATTPLKPETLARQWVRLAAAWAAAVAAGRPARTPLPAEEDYPNHRLWFRPEVLQELITLRDLIGETVPPGPLRNFARLCLSAIVKGCSNADPRDIFPERDRHRPVRPAPDVFAMYAAAWQAAARKVAAFTQAVGGRRHVRVIQGDARRLPLPDGAAHLAVTSPPYAYALDYARVHQLSTLLLCMPAARFRAHRQHYIGRDRIPLSTPLGPCDGFEFAAAEIRRIHAADRKWGLVLYTYFRDMQQAIAETARVLRTGGRAVYIIGNSTVKGTPFRTGEVLAALCDRAGLRVEAVLERPYYAYRMAQKRNTHSAAIKSDLFIIARKGGGAG